MSRNLRIGAISSLVGSLLFYFVNCSSGSLPDNLEQSRASTSDKSISLTVSPAQITPSQTASAIIAGGTAPFTFTVSQGSAQINSLGAITQAVAGNVQIKVTDANGLVAYASLYVSAPVVPAASNCTTPWGVTVTSGSSIGGFATATVDCPNSAAACTPVTLTCTNGVLSGANLATAGASCSVRSCLLKPTSSKIGCINGMRETILPGTTIPSSCDASQWHQYFCIGIDSGAGYATELECVSPNETPTP